MADAFSRLIEEFNKHIGPATGLGSATWGSRQDAGRLAIRESLKRQFNDWSENDLLMINDLQDPPRPFNRSVSISHTHDFGGWMSVTRPAQIGWDIELKVRIKDHIIKRVCSEEEVESVPHLPLLWSAKEAFYKALEDEQPEVIMQVTIDEWRSLAPGLWSWRGLGPRNGEGIVLDSEPWTLAACRIR